MPSEEVIEISVEETNKLRAELGLAPLRLHNDAKEEPRSQSPPPVPEAAKPTQDDAAEVLEMSVDETNKLREKLGLPPLRTGSASSQVQDAKLKEKQQAEQDAQAEERAKLEDDVEKGISSTFTEKSLGADESNDVNSWAAKLRQSKGAVDKKKKKKKKGKTTKGSNYDEGDLKGMNVSHGMSELEAGSTTVMTLADAPLLQTNESNPHIVTGINEDANTPQLENVNLAEQSKQADGLRKKRQLEMGMGRAGGYAGFDDDEFVELGGTQTASRSARGAEAAGPSKPRKGFLIGDANIAGATGASGSDLFAMEAGNAISLESGQADLQASDFMTEQEDLELRGKDKKKKSKRKDKFDKKKKKKDKKDRKKHRRRQEEEEEESEEEATPPPASGKSLLDDLEETAEASATNGKSRKRSRSDDDEGDAVKMEEDSPTLVPSTVKLVKSESNGVKKADKRAKYDAIMDKGNARTKQAFGAKTKRVTDDAIDEEPDDAFLNAALAKARRLKKLRGMSAAPKGAEAVVEAVQRMPDAAPSGGAATGGGMTFSVDDTREFTRALRARTEQQSRQQSKAEAKKDKPAANTISTAPIKKEEPSPSKMEVETVKQEEDEDVDMAELAKEIKDDDKDASTNFLDGTTGTTVAVGRGLAGVLDLFKQTGELTRKNAGKEELRGRAKDERTYEDYDATDLKKVVKIDNRTATQKDRELASREIKLEYRDKQGRLLTRKEAYRELCYQFHGKEGNPSKRKEEKRQKQLASQKSTTSSDGTSTTLGALKATQKATGKAFVVHKT